MPQSGEGQEGGRPAEAQHDVQTKAETQSGPGGHCSRLLSSGRLSAGAQDRWSTQNYLDSYVSTLVATIKFRNNSRLLFQIVSAAFTFTSLLLLKLNLPFQAKLFFFT